MTFQRRTRRLQLRPIIEGLQSKRPSLIALATKIRGILAAIDDKSINQPEHFQARDVAKSLLELAAALAYTPCPSCLGPCSDWIVKQKPCGEIHESKKEAAEETKTPVDW